MKLVTFAVPCYNSAEYMDRCVQSLLPGGEEVEIILIDDGSKDETGAICDSYAEAYPSIIKVIHQENGGHGEGVNQGLRHATGLYYKVVDSDDWAEAHSLRRILKQLRIFANMTAPVDLLICNYVYESIEDNAQKRMHYTNVFPQDRVFGWNETGRFRLSQYLLMHSAIYRTDLLRECGMVLPKHTFYVDNLFVYEPLPYVKTLFYMDLDFYRYRIGRADQSVNEKVMVSRVDQQLRITKRMLRAHNLSEIKKTQPKLAKYMASYLSMMIAISSILLLLDGTQDSLEQRSKLWSYLRRTDPGFYYAMRYRSVSAVTIFPGYIGRKLSILVYRVSRRIYRFS